MRPSRRNIKIRPRSARLRLLAVTVLVYTGRSADNFGAVAAEFETAQ